MPDRNFDDLANRFAKNIYEDPKGRIRLHLVREELLTACPALAKGQSLRVLDAGCGMGQVSVFLAGLGHQVTCCDISETMLLETTRALDQMHPDAKERVRFFHSSVQDLSQHLGNEWFDVVIFHAVLEWMENPEQGLRALLAHLAPGGNLSIMFYNRHSLVFKNLLRGNFAKIDKKDFRGDPGGLTPISPLDPVDVERWLCDAGLAINHKRGIRCFYDYMDHVMNHKKTTAAIDEIIRMERAFGVLEPYRSLARYILIHASSKTSV